MFLIPNLKFRLESLPARSFLPRLATIAIFFSLALPPLASAQVNKMRAGELQYTLQGEGPSYQLLISPANGLSSLSRNLTANVFSVKKPSRLVIDLPGFSKGRSKAVDLSDTYLSAMRLGIHADKTRIVLDIKSDRIPVYDVAADPNIGALVVSFALSSNPTATSSTPKPMAQNNPVPQVKKMQTPDLSQTSTATSIGGTPVPIQRTISDPIPLPKVEAVKTPKMATGMGEPMAAKKPELSKQTIVVKGNEPPVAKINVPVKKSEPVLPTDSSSTIVKGILFQAPKDSPLGALVIEGTNIEKYSLNQKGPNLYELIVNGARLEGQHLTLPQFPPESFKGFEVVLSNQVDSDVVVKIYVNDGVSLAPYLAKGKLWVKASQK